MTPDGYMEKADWARFKHFTPEEFDCRCGCGKARIKYALVEGLTLLRSIVKQPIIINSGYRCPERNREVGGVPDSQHIVGAAADIYVAALDPQQVAKFAELVRVFERGGIGIYLPRLGKRARAGWVHVDVRGKAVRWTDK